MRIAQVSPLYESVPPKLYGGTERVVYFLTEELVKRGKSVTLFASGDSNTSAKLVPICSSSLRLSAKYRNEHIPHVIMLERVCELSSEFDIIHFHLDYLHFPIFRRNKIPHLTTMHGRLDLNDALCIHAEYAEMP